MKKVGIVSCYFKNNYGSMLQAYATQKILDENNIPNETINIDNNIDFKNGKRKYYLSQVFNFNFINSKFGMIKLKLDKKFNKKIGKNISVRTKKYNEFKRLFNLSRSCKTYNDLTELAKEKYSDVIVGSDQLWLPVNVVSDYYTLNWVPDSINKISYSTSFGVSSIPKKYNELYTKFLKKINNLSVREESGVKLIKDISNIDAKLVCDPTILLPKEEWDKIATSVRRYKEKYILCYFLGNNTEHRKFAERLKKETGYKIVSLNHADEYVKYSDAFCDYAPYDIGPCEFLNLIKNAEYILTDSFHCTVFSIIYNKLFFDFRRMNNNSKISTNSRLDSLLNVAGIKKERILSGKEDIKEVLKYKIDYKKVNDSIKQFRENSKKWLLDSITWKDDNIKYVNITSKEDCCGCSACMNICPKGAIEMVEDEEGFKYPKINKDKCINCGMCKKICPILNRKEEVSYKQVGYVVNNKDNKIRNESTSGGAFTAIATYVIKKGGKVYGAAYDTDFAVKHISATTIDELSKFRNSKYVQSDINTTYKQVKEDLNNNLLVCFSGTPCQIEGLRSFLNKEYDNLILVDIVCHAVPSPKLFRNYLKYIKKEKLNNEEIESVHFRDKSKYGYKYSQMKVTSKNNNYEEGIDTDQYFRAFFSSIAIRPSCENCKFKKIYRVSDITMWDCFNIEDLDKGLSDNIGTTRVLIHSSKGNELFDKIKDDLDYTEINSTFLIKDSKELVESTHINHRRHEFLSKIDDDNDIKELLDEYLPINSKTKIERFVRRSLVNFSFYNKIKKVAKRIIKR